MFLERFWFYKCVKLREENKQLKEKVEGYKQTRDRLIEMGFPTFMSCREYAEKLEKLEEEIEDLKEAKARMTQKSYDVQVENNKLKKRIKELESIKDVADLLRLNNDTVITMVHLNNKLASATQRLEKLEEDLKHKKIAIQNRKTRIKKLEKQLEQAKKLLAKWVELFKPKYDSILPPPIQVDTEKFLKEVER